MSEITIESVKGDLFNLGIKEGDVVFLTIDLLKVGLFVKNRKVTLNAWVELLIDTVGDKGCVVLASYTRMFFRFKKNKEIIFNRTALTTSGSLPKFLVSDKRAKRSTHPTMSCIGIGFGLEDIFKNHDHNAKSYSVFKELLEKKAKFLMVGTLDKKNAPQALHYAQELLGHTLQSPMKNLFQTYFENKQNELEIFTYKDLGGCSRGAYRLFGPLIVNEIVEFGKVGNARSAIMDGRKCLEVVLEELKKDRRVILCDNKDCIQCFGQFRTNGIRVIPFYLRKVLQLINKQFIKN